MAVKTGADTAVGIFQTKAQAESAIMNLKAAGFTADQVGSVTRDADGTIEKTGTQKAAATGTGAATGAALGAAGGAAVGAGILAGVIPVIGPVLAIGTLGTILVNAAGGAAALGLAGALTGWGLSDDDAAYYESEVKTGKHLVTVNAGSRMSEARSILDSAKGFDRTGWIRNTAV